MDCRRLADARADLKHSVLSEWAALLSNFCAPIYSITLFENDRDLSVLRATAVCGNTKVEEYRNKSNMMHTKLISILHGAPDASIILCFLYLFFNSFYH